MRRILLTVVTSTALLAAAPAIAIAGHHEGRHHHHHHRGHHHGQVRHAGIRHESWGSDEGQAPTGDEGNAGTVDTFQNGVLTITLTNGKNVDGQVTDASEITCEAPENAQMQNDDHGDNSQGEDNGDQGENQGEDQGEDQQEMCGPTALTHGATVREAELSVSSTGSVWEKVELITPPAS